MASRLIEIVENLPRSRVLLVGDALLDRYLYGNVERISPEAPVPVLHFQREETRLGGAANVAANLAALKADVILVATIGDDEAAAVVRRLLTEAGIAPEHIIATPGRPTVTKTRLVGSAQHRHAQTMMRLDYENPAPLDGDFAERVKTTFEKALGGSDIVCIEDYNKGLLSAEVCRFIIETAKHRNIPILIDPASISDFSRYTGATALKMNRPEAERATGMTVSDPQSLAKMTGVVLANLQLEAVIITLDKRGCYLATRDGEHRLLHSKPRQVFDVTGAGDMVHAVLTVARAAGASWADAAALANVAGGLEVEKFGAVPISPDEIAAELFAEQRHRLGKLRSIEKLLPELARHRAAGKKIVFTNGCFDLIHLGHVKYFQFARAQGDLLVVGVNTDASIRRVKGPKRPIINEHDRTEVLEELESIDYLVKFNEDTPIELIRQIAPDVLVKGADYSREQVVGWEIVESNGGRIALAPLIDGRSTSAVIQRILEAYT